MKRAVLPILAATLLAALHPAGVPEGVASPRVVKDLTHREVVVPASPSRVICLGPGALRLIVYLGAADKVCGIEEIEKRFPNTRPYWLANPQLGALPVIGPGGPQAINRDPDLEAVLRVQPQVIFVTYMEAEKAASLQKKTGIPVVVLSYGPFGSFDETLYTSLRLAGTILERGERAETLVRAIAEVGGDLRHRVSGVSPENRPRVYVGGIGFRGTQGIESTDSTYPPFTWVEAANVAANGGEKGHRFVDKETILGWNPDILFIDGGDPPLIRQDYLKHSGFYAGLKAVAARRVYSLHAFNWYMTNVGTVLADAYTVGKRLYPERFEDVDVAAKADALYTFLVGRPVHGEMVKTQGPLGQVWPVLMGK